MEVAAGGTAAAQRGSQAAVNWSKPKGASRYPVDEHPAAWRTDPPRGRGRAGARMPSVISVPASTVASRIARLRTCSRKVTPEAEVVVTASEEIEPDATHRREVQVDQCEHHERQEDDVEDVEPQQREL